MSIAINLSRIAGRLRNKSETPQFEMPDPGLVRQLEDHASGADPRMQTVLALIRMPDKSLLPVKIQIPESTTVAQLFSATAVAAYMQAEHIGGSIEGITLRAPSGRLISYPHTENELNF